MTALEFRLYGAADCRRYRRMKERLLRAAAAARVEVVLQEINQSEALMQFNPLSLPRLYAGEKLLAAQNPPAESVLRRYLETFYV